MTTPLRAPAVALLLAAAAPTALAAQGYQTQRNAFTWEGTVPSGRWVYLRNLNGDVYVQRADGDRVTVTADKTWRRGDGSGARVVQQAAPGGGVAFCTLYGDGGACDPANYRSGKSGGGQWRDRGGDEEVSFRYTVRVPAGVRVDLRTTNGNVGVRGAGSEVVASTTNGNVGAESAGGPVTAHTTNGDVNVRMGSVGGATDLDFSTTNGSVYVTIPESLGAQVSLATTNGSVSSEFPVTVQGRVDGRRLNFTLGDGSRRVRMRTTNGDVELRRAR